MLHRYVLLCFSVVAKRRFIGIRFNADGFTEFSTWSNISDGCVYDSLDEATETLRYYNSRYQFHQYDIVIISIGDYVN